MTIVGGLSYHLSSKAIPEQNPFAALSVAYTLQAIICVVLMFGTSSGQKIHSGWNYWILGLVFGSIMLELGLILADRAGWDLSNADLTSVAVVAWIFVPVGMLFYQEPVTLQRVAGISVSILGLYLIRKNIRWRRLTLSPFRFTLRALRIAYWPELTE